MTLLDRYTIDLAALKGKGRLRELSHRAGLDFASNDYLGLASSRRLARALASALEHGTAVGAGGSRLLRGNDPEHEALESEAAQFFHAPASLLFGSGYQANVAVLATLPQRGDLIVFDALSHASTIDGARASRAEIIEAAHNDCEAVDARIRLWRENGGRGHPWIAVESLYSMDGDRAPLADLATIAERHDGYLLIDEAHATGVFGPNGRGLAHSLEGRENVVVLHTFGKALGGSGALITCAPVLREFLINRCRQLIFATAPSPLMAVAAHESLVALCEEPERQARLHALIRHYQQQAARYGVPATDSQIQPVVLGDDALTIEVASSLQQAGFDVRGIRPPTVPEGTSRLRVSLTLNVTAEAVSALLERISNIAGNLQTWATG
jgi:8-amino-7-oxononanoate synthase